MQIRTKLTLQFALMAGGILVAFSLVIFSLSANYRKQEFKERLREKAINTAKLLIEVKEVDNELMRIIDSANYSSLENIEVVVFDYFKRSRIYSSGKNSGIVFSEEMLSKVRNNNEYSFKIGNREAVGLLYTDGLRRFVVFASASDRYGVSKLNNLILILIVGLLVAIILTFITGLFFSRQALKPISGVVSRVSSITATSLGKRLDEGNGTDEIAKLAITFNQMLYRIEKAFQIQKYNELGKRESITEGQAIYIVPKKNKSKEGSHKVSNGETMRDIARFYGVKLKALYKMNGLQTGHEPEDGTTIKLKK